MRRRTRVGPERAKSRRRKTIKQKRRGLRNPSAANHKTQSDVAQIARERDEALRQQTATADILTVISNSLGDTQPVFDAIVASGLKLFPGATVTVALADGDQVNAVAVGAPDPAGVEAVRRRMPFPLTREYITSTAILDRRVVDISDAENVPAELAIGSRNLLATGYRAMTVMPMLRGDVAIGTLNVLRLAPGPLSVRQLDVLRTFAKQAVIAIENTRVLSELRESLQQQTATADVLKVISSSPGELEPVFRAMLENATRICGAHFGSLWRFETGAVSLVSNYNHPPAFAEFLRQGPHRPHPHNPISRVIKTSQALHIVDYRVDQAYLNHDPLAVAGVEIGGIRTLLVVPMIKDEALLGAIGIFHQQVRPFTEKQIALVASFASQAVIAIENARLLNELRQRTADLSESLQQQTATADVRPSICRPCLTRWFNRPPGFARPIWAPLSDQTTICYGLPPGTSTPASSSG
jgi:two-component system, NtrC family, sensor kinase